MIKIFAIIGAVVTCLVASPMLATGHIIGYTCGAVILGVGVILVGDLLNYKEGQQ